MEAVDAAGGFLDLYDKSSPEQIKSRMDMSKNEFKRAVGHLLKTGMIVLEENGIRRRGTL